MVSKDDCRNRYCFKTRIPLNQSAHSQDSIKALVKSMAILILAMHIILIHSRFTGDKHNLPSFLVLPTTSKSPKFTKFT